MKPFRLLDDSIKQFGLGLGPGIVMAFACLAIQVFLLFVLPTLAGSVWHAFFPPEPPPDPMGFLNRLGEARGWRDQARDLFGYTLAVSMLFFFHALVALVLTAWLLRKRVGLDRHTVLRRALHGAATLTCAAAVVFATAFALDDLLPATRFLDFPFGAAGMLALWFGATALLLPARLMGHEPVTTAGRLRTTLVAAIALLPWFFVSEMVGGPLRNCHECAGLFEGAIVFYPRLGAYLLFLTVSSAAVSAAACMPTHDRHAERAA
ncbi:MAG TPA: hypothetical protein VF432_03360 [Thermoanaerobaculia bacterium]